MKTETIEILLGAVFLAIIIAGSFALQSKLALLN